MPQKKLYAPQLAKSNPDASSGNIIQSKVAEALPTVDLNPSEDPATVDINFTKAGAGPYTYRITAGAAGDNQPKRVWWFKAINGTAADACPQTQDDQGTPADLDERSGIDADVTFTPATMYALVETEGGNLTTLTLS